MSDRKAAPGAVETLEAAMRRVRRRATIVAAPVIRALRRALAGLEEE